MKQRDEIRTGDPIEVQHFDLSAGHKEFWRPATTGVCDDKIIVAIYADGTRQALPKRVRTWRPA